MEKKENYFKRIKKPITKYEDAKPLKRETLIYFFIALASAIVFSALSTFVPSVSWLFTLLGIIGFGVTIYFGLVLYAMSRVLKRFKNMHCECGEQFVNDENTEWQVVSKRWVESNDSKKAEATCYVTVKFICKCPKCGKVKTFTETLRSGTIRVTDRSARENLVSTQQLVDDYFAGIIHG